MLEGVLDGHLGYEKTKSQINPMLAMVSNLI